MDRLSTKYEKLIFQQSAIHILQFVPISMIPHIYMAMLCLIDAGASKSKISSGATNISATQVNLPLYLSIRHIELLRGPGWPTHLTLGYQLSPWPPHAWNLMVGSSFYPIVTASSLFQIPARSFEPCTT